MSTRWNKYYNSKSPYDFEKSALIDWKLRAGLALNKNTINGKKLLQDGNRIVRYFQKFESI